MRYLEERLWEDQTELNKLQAEADLLTMKRHILHLASLPGAYVSEHTSVFSLSPEERYKKAWNTLHRKCRLNRKIKRLHRKVRKTEVALERVYDTLHYSYGLDTPVLERWYLLVAAENPSPQFLEIPSPTVRSEPPAKPLKSCLRKTNAAGDKRARDDSNSSSTSDPVVSLLGTHTFRAKMKGLSWMYTHMRRVRSVTRKLGKYVAKVRRRRITLARKRVTFNKKVFVKTF